MRVASYGTSDTPFVSAASEALVLLSLRLQHLSALSPAETVLFDTHGPATDRLGTIPELVD